MGERRRRTMGQRGAPPDRWGRQLHGKFCSCAACSAERFSLSNERAEPQTVPVAPVYEPLVVGTQPHGPVRHPCPKCCTLTTHKGEWALVVDEHGAFCRACSATWRPADLPLLAEQLSQRLRADRYGPPRTPCPRCPPKSCC